MCYNQIEMDEIIQFELNITRNELDVKVQLEKIGGKMFSQTVEYALRAVAFLASQTPEARTTDQIAVATKVPKAYLSKVIQALSRGGVFRSQRGSGGGVVLVKSPAELSVLEVVNAVDPVCRIQTCPLGLAAHGERLCPLHKRMDNVLAQIEQTFRSTTLAEILAEPSESIPLCDFPPMASCTA